jgi:hypothetical protein
MATSTNEPTTSYNLDVVYINDKLCRYAGEVILAVSSNLAHVNSFDMARALKYLDDLDAAIAYVLAQPQLDMPETHPRERALQALPTLPNMENDELDHVVRLLEAARFELINSQSGRMAAGFLPFDAARVTALVEKTRQWLTTFVSVRSPMDLPETSPQQLVTGPGKGGV